LILDKGFTFIDLFAGIGGFHQAMSKFGGVCVYASEITIDTADTYSKNYGLKCLSDITKEKLENIPDHDVLCAGFPCQSFSMAGKQNGFKDERGILFLNIIAILKEKKSKGRMPKILVLENVRNLITHDKGKTWTRIRTEIDNCGYNVVEEPIVLSPFDFGIPQSRERAIIFAIQKSICNQKINLEIPNRSRNKTDAYSILTKGPTPKKYYLSEYEKRLLIIWDEFIRGIKEKTIGFPIWTKYFFGKEDISSYPEWKKQFVYKNILLYNSNKSFIDQWYKKYNYLKDLRPTDRKFEWQAGNHISSVFKGIIQFRPSGVRVKRPTEFPSLVAMVHVPIVGKYKRYITPREAARLQSFPDSFIIPDSDHLAYQQFGNAVNVEVIYQSFLKFLDFIKGCEKHDKRV